MTYNLINTAQSALASFITLGGGISVGKKALISRVFKEVFQS